MKDLILQQVREVGLGIAAFCLMSWMVITITTDMVRSIDNVTNKLNIFTARVVLEHQQQTKEHEQLMVQHKGITETLGRINGYKKD